MKTIHIFLLFSMVAVLCYCQIEKEEDSLDKDSDKKKDDEKKDDKKDPVKKDDEKKPGTKDPPRPQGLLALLDILSRVVRNECFNDIDCLETVLSFRETSRGRLPPILEFLTRISEGFRNIRRLMFGSDALEREVNDERAINIDLNPFDILNPFRRFARRRIAPGLSNYGSEISRLRNNEIGNLPYDNERFML